MEGIIKFKTSSPAGDLLSILPGIKQLCKDKDVKAMIYQRIDVVGEAHPDAIPSFVNEKGQGVWMNKGMFEALAPLIKHQDYVQGYELYNGEEIDIDLDLLRCGTYANIPRGSLNRWAFYIWPEMSADLSKEWLKCGETNIDCTGKVIINHTERYRHYLLTYYFLKPYEKDLFFVGLEREHEKFCTQWNLEIPLLKTKDLLELSGCMKKAKFFMGNASACFQIAEGMKIPRMLELFAPMPNVIPIGEKAYDYYHQTAAEFYFQKLYNEQ